MRLYEYEGKQVLAAEGIRTPRAYGLAIPTGASVRLPAGAQAMVKAQVLVGGRGKAGGIRRAASQADLDDAISEILGMRIHGYPVQCALVEETVDAIAAFYLGVTMNPATFNNVVIAGVTGGVDIEEAARTQPESILRVELPESPAELPPKAAKQVAAFLAKALPDAKAMVPKLVDVVTRLYGAYQKCDAKVLEINPLLITAKGPVAADAKMVLDDNALYRQTELLAKLSIASKRHEDAESTEREKQAVAGGFPYVDLLPEDVEREPGKVYVGLVPGGAGYGIFSIDETTGIGEKWFQGRIVPVNFMDSGGGPTLQSVSDMFSLLMDWSLIDVIVTSRFGGISSCDIFIRGLVDCLRKRHAEGKRVVPVYGRMVGTDLSAARVFLDTARTQTPEPLAALSMVVGNREIMAQIIRKGISDYLAKQEAAQ